MPTMKALMAFFLLCLVAAAPIHADEGGDVREEGAIFTLWPLVDYRESPGEHYSNLSILGPLFKLQRRGDERDIALRPLFYVTENERAESAKGVYLYPLASSESSPDVATFEVLELFQRNIFRKNEGEDREKSTMLFPLYISGNSKKYGPYTSVFPFYGDIYERFGRDEWHYVLFPLYGRTVNKGTTNRNYLYPFFSTTEGEKESGFQFWPIYGQSAKEGVYSKRFVLWPFFMQEQKGLDTDNPTTKLTLFPLYAATDSPKRTERYVLWPFFGHTIDTGRNEEEWDYFWPFLLTVRGEKRNFDRYLPFYSNERRPDGVSTWFMWPLYWHYTVDSDQFSLERHRILYFLFADVRETWPKDGAEKRRTAFWPLFFYTRDQHGIKSLSIPAPVEPVLDREGIEKDWAPFWRLYLQKWNDRGDSAVSFLWNLYWHEVRGDALAYELFPLVSYRSEKATADFSVLKGLFRYRDRGGEKKFTFLWLPFGVQWGKSGESAGEAAAAKVRSEKGPDREENTARERAFSGL